MSAQLDGNIKKILSDTLTKCNKYSVKEIIKLTKSKYAILSSKFININNSGYKHEIDDYFFNNFYILETAFQQTIIDLKAYRYSNNLSIVELIFAVFKKIISDEKLKIDSELINKIIKAIENKHTLSLLDYEFLPVAIRTCILIQACCSVENNSLTELQNKIVLLKDLAFIDFDEILTENYSVEKILVKDPSKVYEKMTDETKYYYRKTIVKISEKINKPEYEVATEALNKANAAKFGSKENNIGQHIINNKIISIKKTNIGRASIKVTLILTAIGSLLLGIAAESIIVFLFSFLPFFEFINFIVNDITLTIVDRAYIPKIDITKCDEVPVTAVVISVLITKSEDCKSLYSRLEELYFSNNMKNVVFCVLADYKENDYPNTPHDDIILQSSINVIESLNKKYKDKFMLFFRNKIYSKTQASYSGWERKRGAVTEFIRLINGSNIMSHNFTGNQQFMRSIKYLIVLDSDTQISFDSIGLLIGAALHPLNKAVIDDSNERIIEGYGVFTPQLEIDFEGCKKTRFTRLMSSTTGGSHYQTLCSDFYQDTFGESLFCGKGLIDVDAFYKVLNDKFPTERILSHDIIEGEYLRTAFVSDVKMYDGIPSNPITWYARLHRWIRGDWQNIIFLSSKYKNNGEQYNFNLKKLSKHKLIDNLRRSINPIINILCLIISLFLNESSSLALTLVVLLSIGFPYLYSAFISVAFGGIFALKRKFFTYILPSAFESILRGLYAFVFLFYSAVVNFDAIVRSLYRVFISKKNLMQWTTAAHSESGKLTFIRIIKKFGFAELFAVWFIYFSRYEFQFIYGIAFLMVIPWAYYLSQQRKSSRQALSECQKQELLTYNAAMYNYYNDFANEENNYLPPDNIQQAPTYAVARRTSPTNIGLMLLSILAARDFEFINTKQLFEKVEKTISTVEKMKKYKGNLYNWYDTATLEILNPKFISAVDSGNFVCCLVALKEGIKEYLQSDNKYNDLIERVEKIINQSDFSFLYCNKLNLLSIGYNQDENELFKSHYDFLMSEARLTSYFIVAQRLVNKKHWKSLNRTMSKSGSFAGPVSWTGTMFEYFMPHMLLPAYDDTLLSESLNYCLYCQKKRTHSLNIPWGISESAYYSFDNYLNYQYKAHGVQAIGVKRGLNSELVVSPYSTFLTITFNPTGAIKNLKRYLDINAYGKYGFFEAVDYVEKRIGNEQYTVIKSYMAHHIGMSIISSVNAINDNIMQKRFMRDSNMNSCKELLQEKMPGECILIKELPSNKIKKIKNVDYNIKEEFSRVFPQNPNTVLLSNSEISDIMTDNGSGFIRFADIDITRRSSDMLRRPQGIFTIIKAEQKALSLTKAPFYNLKSKNRVEFSTKSVTYFAENEILHANIACKIHRTDACEHRTLTITNIKNEPINADILFYLEPVLARYKSYDAHFTFSKLFVMSKYDINSKALLFYRRNRDDTQHPYLAVALMNYDEFEFETKRENLMPSPDGLHGLLNFDEIDFSNNMGTPDCCCAIKLKKTIDKKASITINYLIAIAKTEKEAINIIASARNNGKIINLDAAPSPVINDTIEGRVGNSILSQLVFNKYDGKQSLISIQSNSLPQSSLWQLGISGDLPIVVVEAEGKLDTARLEIYIKIQEYLKLIKFDFDICVIYDSLKNENIGSEIDILYKKNQKVFVEQNRLFLVDINNVCEDVITLIKAAAAHISKVSMVHFNMPATEYNPIILNKLKPIAMPQNANLNIFGGAFYNEQFYINKSSPLPYTHILTNQVFGTLLSDKALGFTFAVNSNENKLTPWLNDITTDNTGEMLIINYNGKYYDAVNGSRAIFSPNYAQYVGAIDNLIIKTKVSVSETGFAKYVDVEYENIGDNEVELFSAYYTEPVMHSSTDYSRFIKSESINGKLILNNPYSNAISGFMVLSAQPNKNTINVCNKADFWLGKWDENSELPNQNCCASTIIPLKLPAKRNEKIRFILSYGINKHSAVELSDIKPEKSNVSANCFTLNTPDKYLNEFINNFVCHQVLKGRIWGRCGFYQCGGAYGFRDQLQDVSSYMIIDAAVAKQQIYRCCAVQFIEGDVLHWWHNLPKNKGGLKGVRTKYSDDLLWLPYVVSEYISKTNDVKLLDAKIRYITSQVLTDEQNEAYISPEISNIKESVYEHCIRAINKAYRIDDFGLPFMGCGDWNDGYNRVGTEGKGTSVWLAMFLCVVMKKFAAVCEIKNDHSYIIELNNRIESLKKTIDEKCWDGNWYLRAFYDDASPMGSKNNEECMIDSLPQSFAVFADMPNKERVDVALNNALKYLVDENEIVRLFYKPFQYSNQQPGYVKAYPEGIRENGGQYSHAAIWLARALLLHGKHDDGYKLIKMLNPVYRNSKENLASVYKTEPYYMSADIYTNPNCNGRGGWSIYTGAASWYFRTVIEDLLGIIIKNDRLYINPNILQEWDEFSLSANINKTKLNFTYKRTGNKEIKCNNNIVDYVTLDGQEYNIMVYFN